MTQYGWGVRGLLLSAAVTLLLGAMIAGAVAATADDLDKDAAQALQALCETRPAAEAI